MKNSLSLLSFSLALAAMFGALSAQAAPTTELKVKGTIQPPGCMPTLAGGGTADFGTISRKSLNTGNTTSLGQKSIAFSIACTAKMKIALRANDNRQSSVIGGAPAGAFGLGVSQEKKIGYYVLKLQTISGDGSAVNPLSYSDGGSVWVNDALVATFPAGWAAGNGNIGTGRVAFASSGTAPGSYTTISGVMVIDATIDKTSNLPASEEIPLDGSATIEVQYI